MSGSYLLLKENHEKNESTNGASLQHSTLKDESNHAQPSFFNPSTWMSSDFMSLLLLLFLFDIAFRLLEKALDAIRQRLKAKRHPNNDEAVLKEQSEDVKKDHQ
jgi:hypothetical protein